jgi:hypothetical protein
MCGIAANEENWFQPGAPGAASVLCEFHLGKEKFVEPPAMAVFTISCWFAQRSVNEKVNLCKAFGIAETLGIRLILWALESHG